MRRRSPARKRAPAAKPIRLKVVYRTPEALVTEYTTSLSKGGCTLRAAQPLPIGTRFAIDMFARGETQPVRVEGRVEASKPVEADQYEITVRYLGREQDNTALRNLLDRILSNPPYSATRKHPRVPVNLIARDGTRPTLRYLIRDLSRGGFGLRFSSLLQQLPPDVGLGTEVLLLAAIEKGEPVALKGHVVWVIEGRPGFTHAGVGVEFGALSEAQATTLDVLVRLRRPARLDVMFVGSHERR